MQSLEYKAYYDREADDCCFILNPKADTQATKVLFCEFR